jgi:UDP-N-acetylglucosamine 2-epimerase (non-hydrolysing)
MLVFIIGTRPEAIKLRPLIIRCRERNVPTFVVYSGQQPGIEERFFRQLNLPIDFAMSERDSFTSISNELARQIIELSDLLSSLKPAAVIIQGDTTTTLAGALTASLNKIPLIYVEAGLRSHDISSPFPEEINRKLASVVANLNFTPSKIAFDDLIAESVAPERVYCVGNTVIDSLRMTVDYLITSGKLDEFRENFTNHEIFVSCHRRELTLSQRTHLADSIVEIAQSSSKKNITFSLHPNPEFSTVFRERLTGIRNVKLVEGLSYNETVCHLSTCNLIITDSGGIQEEAASLRTPFIVYREVTERPECLIPNISVLVEPGTASLLKVSNSLLDINPLKSPRKVIFDVVGDGFTSDKILDILGVHGYL